MITRPLLHLLLLTSLIALSHISVSTASPWLLKPGVATLTAKYDYAFADEEYLASNGRLTPFSLNGAYSSSTYTLGARFGLSSWLELELSLPLREVNYQADPVILLPTDQQGPAGYNYYKSNIINLNQSIMGIADLGVTGRFRIARYPIALAFELAISSPTGYASPTGTFGEKPRSKEDFTNNVGDYVKPENVQDDVTLGDGAFAVTPALLAGYGTASGFFTRLSAGVRFRLNGAGDPFIGEFKVGQLITSWLLIYVGSSFEYALNKGDTIGISVAAKDARLPAQEYGGLSNLELIELTLDRDQLSIPIGLLLKPHKDVEFGFNYAQVIWGRNVSKSHIFSMGVTVRSSYKGR